MWLFILAFLVKVFTLISKLSWIWSILTTLSILEINCFILMVKIKRNSWLIHDSHFYMDRDSSEIYSRCMKVNVCNKNIDKITVWHKLSKMALCGCPYDCLRRGLYLLNIKGKTFIISCSTLKTHNFALLIHYHIFLYTYTCSQKFFMSLYMYLKITSAFWFWLRCSYLQ